MSEPLSLDDLRAYLDQSEQPYILDSVATHGFLSAVVVGPALPNWLDVLFEHHAKEVPDNVKAAVIKWRDALLDELKNEQPISVPINDHDDHVDFSDASDVVAWSIGFVDAMYSDDAADWFYDEDSSEDVAVLTLPMVVLSGIDDDPEILAMRQDEDTLAQMVNGIEDNLTELFLLFHTND